MNQKNSFTPAQLAALQKDGKIRGYEKPKPPAQLPEQPGGRVVTKLWPTKSEEKNWIALNLMYWANERAITLEEEYLFHPERKWRFDWAIPALKIGIEYEGVISEKSRHTTISGFTADCIKYNQAALHGWLVLRYTAINYRELFTDLNTLHKV